MAFLTSAPPSVTSYKTPAKVASTSSMALSGVIGSIQIDSIALSSLSTGDRILLKNQGVDNGIYELTVSGPNYSLARSLDADTSAKLSPNSLVPVSQGTVNADNVFQLTNNSVNLGTDSLVFIAVDSVALAGLAAEVTNRTNANLLDLKIASNLSDLASVGTAKTNLSLQNVDNTSDANKPVSTAQQTALNLKADLISPVFTTPNIGSATGSISGNAATVTTNANLTGPVTSVGNATAIANSAISNAMLANAAVANLSGTNTGDNAATSLVPSQASQANKVLATDGTTTSWQYAGLGSGSFGNDNLFLGAPPPGITSATGNTLIGATYPVRALTSGPGNTALGVNTLIYNTTGGANTAIGRNTLNKNVSGAYNVAVGDGSLADNDFASFNVGIGYAALQANNGNNPNNVAIGGYALHVNVGMTNVALGHYAGRRATTASHEFYLDNQDRGSNAAEKTSGLMFGTFNANPALQTLAINAAVSTPYTLAVTGVATFTAAPVVSSVTASQILASGASKEVVSLSTATYPSLAELAYVKGVTSAVQTQLNSEAAARAAADLLYVPAQSGNTEKVLATDGTATYWAIEGVKTGYPAGSTILGRLKPASISGIDNILISGSAGNAMTSGTDNIAIGKSSLASETVSVGNIAIGRQALENNNNVWSASTAVGYLAMKANTTGFANNAFGAYALESNTTGWSNTAIGIFALRTNVIGSDNTSIGAWSLYHNNGSENVSIGLAALYINSSGNCNTGVGTNAMRLNTTGSNNVAIGRYSLYNNTTANNNVAVGHLALESNTTGGDNVAIGSNAGRYATAGNEFYLNNQNRTDISGDKASSLMYGQFNATASSQTLQLNAKVSSGNGTTTYVLSPFESDEGNSSTSVDLDLSLGASVKVTMTGNATFTFSNPTSGGAYLIKLVQDATGTRTVTWPAAVKWSGGTAPTLTTTATYIDIINLYYDGTNYYGSSILNFAP